MEVDRGPTAERARLLKVLSDPARLSILGALSRTAEPICVCDFTAALHLTQPTVSHHMAKLKAVGLVESYREGIWVYYRVASGLPDRISHLLDAVLSYEGAAKPTACRGGPLEALRS